MDCEAEKTACTPPLQENNTAGCCKASVEQLFQIPECCKRFEAMQKDEMIDKEIFETYMIKVIEFVERNFVKKS